MSSAWKRFWANQRTGAQALSSGGRRFGLAGVDSPVVPAGVPSKVMPVGEQTLSASRFVHPSPSTPAQERQVDRSSLSVQRDSRLSRSWDCASPRMIDGRADSGIEASLACARSAWRRGGERQRAYEALPPSSRLTRITSHRSRMPWTTRMTARVRATTSGDGASVLSPGLAGGAGPCVAGPRRSDWSRSISTSLTGAQTAFKALN